MALRADGTQHQYRFMQDDQPLGPLGRLPKQEGAANVWKIRPCRSPKRELYEIARLLNVDMIKILVSSK